MSRREKKNSHIQFAYHLFSFANEFSNRNICNSHRNFHTQNCRKCIIGTAKEPSICVRITIETGKLEHIDVVRKSVIQIY